MPVTKHHKNHCGVYICTDGTAVKVGVATDWRTRLVGLQNGNPRRITLYAFVHASSMTAARRAELAAHETLAAVRLCGEWFGTTPEVAAAIVRAALDGKPDSYGSVEAISRRALALLKKL
jgi:hypothetical protein